MITVYYGMNPTLVWAHARAKEPYNVYEDFLSTNVDGSDKNLETLGYHRCPSFGEEMTNVYGLKSIYDFRYRLTGNPDQPDELKSDYPNVKIGQWFLDPLNKKGPDYERNKKRILDKSEFITSNFITTSPDVLDFLPKDKLCLFMPNPSDTSFEVLDNFNNNQCSMDVFFALSHGVHRGILKKGKYDERSDFVNKLVEKTPNVKFDLYGINNVQPIWADSFLKSISNAKMGVNLSRGSPIKYYSSDRITQLIGNGLLTFIDYKTHYNNFFDNDEVIFYKNLANLSESIQKYAKDDFSRKRIAKKGKIKYMKYFNSTVVAKYIIDNTFDLKYKKNKYLWEGV